MKISKRIVSGTGIKHFKNRVIGPKKYIYRWGRLFSLAAPI